MIDGPDERRLREIEARLTSDDPRFVRTFRENAERRPRRWPYTLVTVLGALMVLLAIVVGSGQLALLGICVAVIAVMRWRKRTQARADGSP